MQFLRPGALVLAMLLAACSPPYDWREVRPADGGWRAMLPAKPATMTREIHLGELPVKMAMQGAKVDDTAFAVAQAALPDPSADTQAKAIAAMRLVLVRNIAGKELSAQPVPVPLVDAAGKRVGLAAGLALEAEGTVAGKPARLSARLVGHQGRALQALVVGNTVDIDQARTFLDSFSVEALPQ